LSIVVFGSVNMDLTTYLPRLPRPGETLFGRSFLTVPGGKGANQAVAAARLGAPVRLVGRIGQDAFGLEHMAAMEREGINVDGVFRDERSSTGLAVISVDDAGENTITVISGANMAVDGSDVDRCAAALQGARILLLQLEIPVEANLAAARAARRRGVTVVLDPAPARDLRMSSCASRRHHTQRARGRGAGWLADQRRGRRSASLSAFAARALPRP
jgi:ribokinase